MADYPTIIQAYGSEQLDFGGFTTSRTVSGALKIRSYYTADVRQFKMMHDLDDTDKQTLHTFYLNNRKLPFDFVWAADGNTYSCRFLKPPSYKPTQGSRWLVSVYMEVV